MAYHMGFSEIYKNDLAFCLKEIGSKIIYKGFTSYGPLVNEPTEVLAMSNSSYSVQDTTLTLTIPKDSLGPLKTRTTLTVDGKTYTIEKYLVLSNGFRQKIWLTEA